MIHGFTVTLASASSLRAIVPFHPAEIWRSHFFSGSVLSASYRGDHFPYCPTAAVLTWLSAPLIWASNFYSAWKSRMSHLLQTEHQLALSLSIEIQFNQSWSTTEKLLRSVEPTNIQHNPVVVSHRLLPFPSEIALWIWVLQLVSWKDLCYA